MAYLMAACIIIFHRPVAAPVTAGCRVRWYTSGEAPELSQLMAYEFMGWLIVWPLMFYVIAACGACDCQDSRAVMAQPMVRALALFWTLLATTPDGVAIRADGWIFGASHREQNFVGRRSGLIVILR